MRAIRKAKTVAGVSRARMYIRRDLGWMMGYPLGGAKWLTLPENSPELTVSLDRKLLRRSTRTINMLLREFPRALPRLVGDRTRWSNTRRAFLDLLKPAIHGTGELPASPIQLQPYASPSVKRRAQRLRESFTTLLPILAAIEWAWWTDLDGLAQSLRWIEAHAEALEKLVSQSKENAVRLVLRTRQLAAVHGDRRVLPLASLLGDSGLWKQPLECPAQFIHEAGAAVGKKERKALQPPRVRLPKVIIDWISWLSTQDPKTQRRGLDLFDVLIRPDTISAWAQWWEVFDQAFQKALSLPVPQRKKDAIARKRDRARRKLEQLSQTAPPDIPARVLSSLLHALPTQHNADLYRVVYKALRVWPQHHCGAAMRVAFADHWLGLSIRATKEQKPTVLRLIPALTGFLKDSDFDPVVMTPWKDVWLRLKQGKGVVYAVDDDVLEELKSKRQLNLFFGTLKRQNDTVTDKQAELLVQLVANLPEHRINAAFSSLRSTSLVDKYLAEEMVRFAGTITESCPQRFPGVLGALVKAADRHQELDKTLRPLFESFERHGRQDVLLEAAEKGRLSDIINTAFQIGVIKQTGASVPEPNWSQEIPTPTWSAKYPEPLRPALTRLARSVPNAEQTAARLLAKDFPDDAQIRQELETLRTIGSPTKSQQRRITNLENRLTSKPSPSAKRMQNLIDKVNASADRRLLGDWIDAVARQYHDALPDYLGIEKVPDWLQREDVGRALHSVGNLKPPFRTLARTILKARSGPPPWDLRDFPQNRAFMKRMAGQGIDLARWIDDDKAKLETTEDGIRLHLTLERDPLELFHMGGHFNTCLSPGAFNYFSVFANIADINKQVMFARDAQDRVFGRMLLALTDQGGLLPFHPYARSKKSGFDAIAKRFAQDLAQDLGTLVVRNGNISTLVAKEWYDDGPVDLTQQLPPFSDKSVFRQQLAEIAPSELVAFAERHLAPLLLNELTLPLLLSLQEVANRPELAVPMFPLARRLRLPLESQVLLAERLVAANARDLAASLVPVLHSTALRVYRGQHHWPYDVVLFLVDLDPIKALDLLKQTRDKSIRSWEDDWDGFRLVLAARANEKLGRKKKACRFYNLALKTSLDKATKSECRAALSALRDHGDANA